MREKPVLGATDFGIDIGSRKEIQLFRWLLACLLLGKPIRQEIALKAYVALRDAGISSLQKLAKSDWHRLVALLDQARYVRYDFSTASKLIQTARALLAQYGTVSDLIRQARDIRDLEKRLQAFKGIGPVTARIFSSHIPGEWYEERYPPEYEAALRAAEILRARGHEAYIIGGAVRDLWLGRDPKDFDLVTDATPDEITDMQGFKRAIYKDPAQAFGVTRVLLDGAEEPLEIATFRKDIQAHKGRKATKVHFATLEDDVRRRDLTINALALDPLSHQVIDLVDGISDAERRQIRFIGNARARLAEDPLRIMRAIRFKNHLGFTYHPSTAAAITQAVQDGRVEQIAMDRLRDELTRLLLHPSRRQAFTDLDTFGILQRILPEVTAGKNVPQPPDFHAEGDVWHHELLILDYLPPDPSRRLAWAALLHDIGKAVTISRPHEPGARIRFNRHYAIGAEMAKTILRRLRFSNRDINDIVWMIHNHLAIDDLPAMRPSRQQRMLGHRAFEDLLELHRSDAAASWRPGRRHGTKPQFKEIEHLWHTYQSKPPLLQQPSIKRDLGVDGNWLKDYFQKDFELSGPAIGYVLRRLDEWYRDQGVKNRNQYILKARRLLTEYTRARPGSRHSFI